MTRMVDDTPRKRGPKRQELRVETCFAPVLAWVVSWWQGTQLARALDATTLGQRFVVLAVSVVYRGCAMPVAWVLRPAGAKHAWRRAWLRLLRRLRPARPRGWTVIVLADRGLYAPWLFRRITRVGWQPFWRINTGGSCRPAGATCGRPLTSVGPRPGTSWRGTGLALTRNQVPCTWLARGEAGDTAPWRILTDLAPEAREAGGMACGPGLNRALKLPSARGGSGTARAGMTQLGRRACGWRWRWRRDGGSVWAGPQTSLSPSAPGST